MSSFVREHAGAPPSRAMARSVAVLALGLVMAACTYGPTVYGPVNDNGFGYREQAIDSSRYRVTFSGNSVTTREIVENYLLFRAAELTLESGHAYFLIETRATERTDRVIASLSSGIHPSFGYYVHGGYWVNGRIHSVDTFTVVNRYEAFVVIQVFEGPIPEDDPSVYDARDVIETLGPVVVRERDLGKRVP